MAQTKTITAYVVHRVGWEYNDNYYDRRDDMNTPMQTFLDPKKAEDLCRRRDIAHMREQKINPFFWAGFYDGFDQCTSLPIDVVGERLASLRSGAPAEGTNPYERVSNMLQNIEVETLTDEQWNVLWEVADRVRFYTVVPVAIELES